MFSRDIVLSGIFPIKIIKCSNSLSSIKICYLKGKCWSWRSGMVHRTASSKSPQFQIAWSRPKPNYISPSCSQGLSGNREEERPWNDIRFSAVIWEINRGSVICFNSTASSALNAMALVCLEDIVKKKVPDITDSDAAKLCKIIGKLN